MSSLPILFLQFRTDQSLEHEQDVVLENTGLDRGEFDFVNVLDEAIPLPSGDDLERYRAVIAGGSAQFDLSKLDNYPFKDRIIEIKPFFEAIIAQDKPTLAICFGHQLMAELMGGKVELDASQAETGSHVVYLTEEGVRSPLFQGFDNPFYVLFGHKDSITELPEEFELLAYSNRCRYQSYRVKQNIFTVQFHPELNTEQLTWRLMMYPEYVKGRTLEEIRSEYVETDWGPTLLRNFIAMVDST